MKPIHPRKTKTGNNMAGRNRPANPTAQESSGLKKTVWGFVSKITTFVTKQTVIVALTGVALVVIIFAGVAIGNTAKDTKVIEQLIYTNANGQKSSILATVYDLLGRKEKFNLMRNYANAFAEAAINIDIIPKNEAEIFFSIMDSIPSELTVEDFEFKNKTLTIIGKTPGGTLTDSFVDRLDATGHFSLVYIAQTTPNNDGSTQFYIDCVLAVLADSSQ